MRWCILALCVTLTFNMGSMSEAKEQSNSKRQQGSRLVKVLKEFLRYYDDHGDDWGPYPDDGDDWEPSTGHNGGHHGPISSGDHPWYGGNDNGPSSSGDHGLWDGGNDGQDGNSGDHSATDTDGSWSEESLPGVGPDGQGSGFGEGGGPPAWTDLDPNLKLETCSERVIADSGYKTGQGSRTPANLDDCGKASKESTLERLLRLLQTDQRSHVTRRARAVSPQARIVGGNVADVAKFPWLVAIGRADGGQECGASLIAEDWVLTAAHCFKPKITPCEYIVRVGEHNLTSGKEEHEDIPVTDIIAHPGYKDENSYPNDIALVKLSRKVALKKHHINTLCLPGMLETFPAGTKCVVAGWGDQKEGAGDYSNVVRWVEVPLLHLYTGCKNYVEKFDSGRKPSDPKWISHKTHLCAGDVHNGGKDSCQGDSGGPLFCRHSPSAPYVQAGVTSGGFGCGRKGWPGLYTNVRSYLPWINDVRSRK